MSQSLTEAIILLTKNNISINNLLPCSDGMCEVYASRLEVFGIFQRLSKRFISRREEEEEHLRSLGSGWDCCAVCVCVVFFLLFSVFILSIVWKWLMEKIPFSVCTVKQTIFVTAIYFDSSFFILFSQRKTIGSLSLSFFSFLPYFMFD